MNKLGSVLLFFSILIGCSTPTPAPVYMTSSEDIYSPLSGENYTFAILTNKHCIGNCSNGHGVSTGDSYDERYRTMKQEGEFENDIFINGTVTLYTNENEKKVILKIDVHNGIPNMQHVTLYRGDEFTYFGEYKNGEPNGQGMIILKSGITIVSEFENGLPNGHGKMTLPNGDIAYEGGFKDGVSDRYGTINFQNGDKYTGEIKNNKFDGHGTLTMADGTEYEGEFKNSKFDGQGTLTLADGKRYIGKFQNDKPIKGQGYLYLADGSRVNNYKGSEIDWNSIVKIVGLVADVVSILEFIY